MKRWWWMGCACVVAGACGEESPTGVGVGLLPDDAIQTFQVVLDADRYLVWDTAFGQYSAPADAEYALIAHAFEGVLDSRVLLSFDIPASILVTDTAGVQVIDSEPIYVGGIMQLVVDTLTSTNVAHVQAFDATQSWDRATATWNFSADTSGLRVPWTQPGGSPGQLVSTADYEPGDTLQLPFDSATIALWPDSVGVVRGVVLTSTTPGSKLRTNPPSLLLHARSTHRPDTIFEIRVTPLRTFIFSPELPDVADSPRVGGQPSWRGVLRLRERLDTVTVACPLTPDCRVALGDIAVSHAALLLQPERPPPGFSPELPIHIAVHLLLPTPLVPLQRSPVTEALAGTTDEIPVSSFLEPDAPRVVLPVTDLFAAAVVPPDSVGAAQRVSHLALLQAGTRTFGFAQFEGLPQLRLILTITKELQLP